MADNRPCPRCRENGHDSTGNHLWLMKDGNRWTCRKVQYHKDSKVYYEDLDGNPIDDLFGVLETPTAPTRTPSATLVYPWSPLLADYRGISTEVYYKYKTEGSYAHDGTLEALGHQLYDTSGKSIARKVRRLPKDFFIDGTTKGQKIQLFGQSVFPRAKRLLITEGELDAMSAYQMLHVYKVACVSLPLGANVKALMDNLEYLKGFKEVYVCTDQDDAGRSVSRDIANLVPHAKFMKISEKDANAMLQEGKEQEFISAFWDAQVYKPEFIVTVDDVMDKVLKKPTMGEPWPWPTLTRLTYGRNDGEGMYVGAGRICQWL